MYALNRLLYRQVIVKDFLVGSTFIVIATASIIERSSVIVVSLLTAR